MFALDASRLLKTLLSLPHPLISPIKYKYTFDDTPVPMGPAEWC
jgi:hypothetical protein